MPITPFLVVMRSSQRAAARRRRYYNPPSVPYVGKLPESYEEWKEMEGDLNANSDLFMTVALICMIAFILAAVALIAFALWFK